MKRVSLKVAKAIKDAGYPQECCFWFNQNGVEFSYTENYSDCYARPTYLEVWLWLHREKGIRIRPSHNSAIILPAGISISCSNDPEETIVSAIEHLVNINLIR